MSEEDTRTTEQGVNARLLRMAQISLQKGFKPFLSDFDPEKSEREKRKLNRRLYRKNKKGSLYDENGIYLETGADLCDCLELDCPGCHLPCSKCGSTKCGHECRSDRKWAYKSIACEGTNHVVQNSHFKNK